MPTPKHRTSRTHAASRRPPFERSTRAQDPPEFVERVQAESRRKFGASIEELVTDPDLRDIAYAVVAEALRQPPKKIPASTLEVAARMAEVGITLTPGTSDPRDLPVPLDVGFSLTDVVLEERHGLDRE